MKKLIVVLLVVFAKFSFAQSQFLYKPLVAYDKAEQSECFRKLVSSAQKNRKNRNKVSDVAYGTSIFSGVMTAGLALSNMTEDNIEQGRSALTIGAFSAFLISNMVQIIADSDSVKDDLIDAYNGVYTRFEKRHRMSKFKRISQDDTLTGQIIGILLKNGITKTDGSDGELCEGDISKISKKKVMEYLKGQFEDGKYLETLEEEGIIWHPASSAKIKQSKLDKEMENIPRIEKSEHFGVLDN